MNKTTKRFESLERQGWARRFIADEPRLREAVKVYQDAGFEVHLEPLPKETECETCGSSGSNEQKECRICFEGSEDKYKIIFIRPKQPADDSGSPL
ncbi:MAG: hypothetical protein JRJ03_05630 [Deltaproteobacteria bacterium]|nr:hypothetical protein [Deltaproteobacteria bacterium]